MIRSYPCPVRIFTRQPEAAPPSYDGTLMLTTLPSSSPPGPSLPVPALPARQPTAVGPLSLMLTTLPSSPPPRAPVPPCPPYQAAGGRGPGDDSLPDASILQEGSGQQWDGGTQCAGNGRDDSGLGREEGGGGSNDSQCMKVIADMTAAWGGRGQRELTHQ